MARSIDVIGVPFALGGATPGPQFGPEALYRSGILDVLSPVASSVAYHDVSLLSDDPTAFDLSRAKRGRIHNSEALHVMAKLAAARVFMSHRLGHFPVVLGGDHSVSIGTVTEYLDPSLCHGRKVGLVWVDAHYDAHTDRTSVSHYAHGMPLASALGRGMRSLGNYRMMNGKRSRLAFRPEFTLHIGAGEHDCEPAEEALLRKLHVPIVTMSDIHRVGSIAFLRTLHQLLGSVDDIVLSIDLDAIRKDFAPAVSFPSRSGLIPSQLMQIARAIQESGKLRQVEIMEYNPHREHYSEEGTPRTALLVFALLRALLA